MKAENLSYIEESTETPEESRVVDFEVRDDSPRTGAEGADHDCCEACAAEHHQAEEEDDDCCVAEHHQAEEDDDCCAACAAMNAGDADTNDEASGGRVVHFGSYELPLKRLVVFASALGLWIIGLVLLSSAPQTGPLRFLPLIPFVAAYALAGLPVLRNAARRLRRGKALDENFLMSVATIGAFAVGEWEEAVGVMIFYMIGELVQEAAVSQSRRSIKALLALKPDTARVRDGDGWAEVSAASVPVGTRVLVRPGERIPLDGIITEGAGAIDASMLSGESKPEDRAVGDEVRSGTVSIDGVLVIETTRTAENSSAAKIIALVESARDAKAEPEKFITAFAKWYTPIVVGGAVLLAILPPLLIPGAQFADWIYRALILLVISCPCALVVSIPLGYFAGIGGLSRRGIMVKGAVHLDSLYKAKYVAFDKTGTLTQGKFSIVALEPAAEITETALLETAVLAEREYNHTIALAIRQGGLDRGIGPTVSASASYREIAGRGLEISLGGQARIFAGNRLLLESRGIALPRLAAQEAYTAVYIARDGQYYGRILIGDTDKEGRRRPFRSCGIWGAPKR